MIVKVCGMRDPENISAVAALGIQWMGFIFFPRSPRFFEGETIALPKAVERVGVFVNAETGEILKKAKQLELNLLQLHGAESPEQCTLLREAGYPVLKAISVASATDIERTKAYEGHVDYFLFDTSCKGYGGSGKRFDWTVLEHYKGTTPFLLSGGIAPDSMDDLKQFHHPQWVGIDLNSGFETAPARKNVAALKAFLDEIHSHF